MIRKFCLQSQEPFNGSFSLNCIMAPVNEVMRTVFKIVLRRPSALHGRSLNDDISKLVRQDVIACNILQLIIFHVAARTHHAVKTNEVRHKQEQETSFPLYCALNLHGNAEVGVVLPTISRLKIFTTHDVNKINSKSQGNFILDEFHGYTLGVTNHLSSDNQGEQRAPMTLDPLVTVSQLVSYQIKCTCCFIGCLHIGS